MPEKGWYSLTVRKETAVRVRELAKNKGLTVDALRARAQGYAYD